jgi:hypothetical protein
MIKRDRCLYFCKGYKYQTRKDYHIKLDIVPFEAISLPFVSMTIDGSTIIKSGYAWDGPSGPTWDTLNAMIGSLVHDVIYQLIRLGLIEPNYKDYADKMIHDICVEDGMNKIRAWYWLKGLKIFGGNAVKPSGEPKILVAP